MKLSREIPNVVKIEHFTWRPKYVCIIFGDISDISKPPTHFWQHMFLCYWQWHTLQQCTQNGLLRSYSNNSSKNEQQRHVIRTKPLLLLSIHAAYICHACYTEIISQERSQGEEVFMEDVNHILPSNTFNIVSINYVRKPRTQNKQFR